MKYDTFQILGYLSGSNLTFMLTMSFSTTVSKSTFLSALKRQAFFPPAFNEECILLHAAYFTSHLLS